LKIDKKSRSKNKNTKMTTKNLLATVDEYLFQSIYRWVYNDCIKELTPAIDKNGNACWYNQKCQLHRDIGINKDIFIEMETSQHQRVVSTWL